MRVYQKMIQKVLRRGRKKKNRTGKDTLSVPNHHYQLSLQAGYPLLTTKDMGGGVWNSLINEFCWYLSGKSHVRELSEETSIWDAWADDEGRLETAYGRFWRRFPIPSGNDSYPGEAWADKDNTHTVKVGNRLVFDQISYLRELINENPNSRRMVLSAWHPANACVSRLPPCHFSAVFNVSPDGSLHCHLNQRSGDLGLGIPFNIAHYSLLTFVLAQDAGLSPGTFSHTINDLHIYVASGKEDDPHNHAPALKKQLERKPRTLPTVKIEDKDIDDLTPEDFSVEGYDPHPKLKMKVAV